MADGSIAVIYLSNDHIGEVFNIHGSGNRVKVRLNRKIKGNKRFKFIISSKISCFGILLIFDHVNGALFQVMIPDNIILVYFFPDIMNAHIIAVYIKHAGTKCHEINIHVIIHSVLYEGIPEHGITPVTSGGP